jgi:hypothetical protein
MITIFSEEHTTGDFNSRGLQYINLKSWKPITRLYGVTSLMGGTITSEEHSALHFREETEEDCSSKTWRLHTRLHGVITQKTTIRIFIAVGILKISHGEMIYFCAAFGVVSNF